MHATSGAWAGTGTRPWKARIRMAENPQAGAAGAGAATRRFAQLPDVVGVHWFQFHDHPPGGRDPVNEIPGEPIADPEILELLQKMVKQRQESIELYKKGNRPDLVAKEEELVWLNC